MQQNCKQCAVTFDSTDSDLQFYDKVSPVFGDKKYLIPPPTHCPDCREQRRLAQRNERKLHKDVCALCGNSIISSLPPDSPYTVYCIPCWWSDKWDAFSYGRDFDFSRPFFEQFHDLQRDVPKACVLQLNNENCDYNQLIAYSKNAYMCPGSYFVEDCMYVRKSQYCRDCVNSNALNKCELVADSTNCDGCFSSHHLISCRNCSSSSYLSDCTSLKDCFMCSGIQNKQYCFKNKQLDKAVYEKTLEQYAKVSPDALMKEFQAFNQTIVKRAQIQLNSEHSTGDYLYNCHNALNCSDCFNIEDSKYVLESEGVKDSMDISMHDKDIVLCYEMTTAGEKNYLTKFCYCTVASPQSMYLTSCFYLSDGFGCDSIHGKHQYCILNKQYTKQEYEALVPRIVEHMQKTGEWGEFFPIETSLFAYNQTIAQDHYPTTKEKAVAKGWQWRDEKNETLQVEKVIPAAQLPSTIDDIPDDILNWAIQCEATGKPYRIIKQELAFYRKMKLPIPRLHPDERHRRLVALRNPRKLWQRQCADCGTEIHTTYAPDRPETVYCEACYLKAIY